MCRLSPHLQSTLWRQPGYVLQDNSKNQNLPIAAAKQKQHIPNIEEFVAIGTCPVALRHFHSGGDIFGRFGIYSIQCSSHGF